MSHKLERDELLKRSFIPRQGLAEAERSMAGGLIKVVIGPRRAGKSVFALQMLHATAGAVFAYVNFDDERLVPPLDLDTLLKAMTQVYGDTKTIFFDEIQNVAGWELFVNRLQRRGCNIVLTGSNAHLLSRELSSHLTGRYREFRLLPFSFAEFLRARFFAVDETLLLPERQGLVLKHLDEYLRIGGFPEVVVGGIEPVSYLAALFDGILFKDVVKRYGVRYSAKLHDVGRWLIGNVGREYTCTSLKNALAFRSVHTVENYVSYLVEAFLFLSVTRYSPKAKVRMSAPRKIYAYDTGMVNAVRFRTGSDTGRLLENLVAVEWYRRGQEFFAFKTTGGKEVDFLVRGASGEPRLYQVCLDFADPKTRRRELSALAKAGAELGVAEGTVLTWDEEGVEAFGACRVRLVPVWKWLLDI
ncbi:MAG: ATP-binding protein [Desulfobulbaceae bacterium]